MRWVWEGNTATSARKGNNERNEREKRWLLHFEVRADQKQHRALCAPSPHLHPSSSLLPQTFSYTPAVCRSLNCHISQPGAKSASLTCKLSQPRPNRSEPLCGSVSAEVATGGWTPERMWATRWKAGLYACLTVRLALVLVLERDFMNRPLTTSTACCVLWFSHKFLKKVLFRRTTLKTNFATPLFTFKGFHAIHCVVLCSFSLVFFYLFAHHSNVRFFYVLDLRVSVAEWHRYASSDLRWKLSYIVA